MNINTLMLRAIEPPDHSDMTFPGIIRQIKLNMRRKRAFKLLIKRGRMNIWTLHFRPTYEAAFCAYASAHAAHRIRAVMAVGAIFVSLKTLVEFVVLEPLDVHEASHEVWIILFSLQGTLNTSLTIVPCRLYSRSTCSLRCHHC